MGKFQVFKDAKLEYRFRLKANNGEIILRSEGYTTKQNCLNGIASVKRNSPKDERYRRLTSTNYQYYFNLTATNGEIIGTSEMYVNEQGRENGIASVKANAPTADIEDLT